MRIAPDVELFYRTEVSRRTLIHKYNRIASLLATNDRPDLTFPERDDVTAALRREVEAAWDGQSRLGLDDRMVA